MNEIRPPCDATGCTKRAAVTVYSSQGEKVGDFCRACGHRAFIRQLRAEGRRPFAELERAVARAH